MVADELPSGLSDFTPGSQIASYQLAEEIGRGGMAVVYRARDVRLDRWVALKLLAPEYAEDEGFRQRFIRESRAAAAVEHPNIIPIFDAGESDGVLFIAMRFVVGQDVHSLLHRAGPLTAGRALGIITQVAAALDAAHACGLVHRDVKPANMLLGGQADSGTGDHVYLSDFGISKASHATSSLTLTGQVLGTLNYLAPEQVEGRTVDGRADGYALACAAFEMLAGDPPFRRDDNLALMWAQVSAPPPPLSASRPDLPAAVDRVMARELAKSPDARFPTCLAFAGALQEACHPAGPIPPNGTVVAGPARRAAPPTLAGAAGPRPGVPLPAAPGDGELAGARAADLPVTGVAGAGAAAMARAPGATPPRAQPLAQPPAWPPPAAPAAPGGRGFPGRAGTEFPPGPPPPGYPAGPVTSQLPTAPRRPRRRGRGVLIGLLITVLAAVIALFLRGPLGHGNTGGQPTPPPSSAAVQLSPAATVRAYYAAITARHYQRAWQLGGRNAQPGASQAQFEAGYSGTQRDVITSLTATGDTVRARFTSVQTDGTVTYWSGTYVVSDGVIVKFAVSRAS
jgi:tRNA A-37 threonylcarbamoyl transferase component Bud32